MPAPDMIAVEGSSNVRGIGFDGQRIHTWFHSGGHYSHAGTSAEFDAYQASKSKGKHFHEHLKGRGHIKHA